MPTIPASMKSTSDCRHVVVEVVGHLLDAVFEKRLEGKIDLDGLENIK